jgi:hypothetical protein
MATQLHSNELSTPQGVLPLVSRVIPTDVSLDTIMKRRDLLSAINLMFDASGLDDKEIYLALDIDPGHFSNIRKGKPSAHFPINKLNAAMDLCQSEIPLIWQAHSRGKGLHLLESEAERQLRQERMARMKAEERLEYLEGLVTK